MDGLYYQHSGKSSLTGVIAAVLKGSLICCIVAFFYAYLILYSPLVVLNVLATILFGIILGTVCSGQAQKRKLRSLAATTLVTVVVATVAQYYGWAVYLWGLARRAAGDVHLLDFIAMVIQPAVVWKLMLEVDRHGYWSLSGWQPTGVWLGLAWLAEAVIIYAVAIFFARFTMDDTPFCEVCGEWTKKTESVVEALVTDSEEFKRRMEAKDFHYLETAGAPRPDSMVWHTVDVHSCGKCNAFHTLDGHQVKIKLEEGKRKRDTLRVVHNLLATAGEVDAAKRVGAKLEAPKESSQAAGAS